MLALDAHPPYPSTDPKGDFLVGSYLHGPDGVPRCGITTDTLHPDNTAWLGQQFVTLITKRLGTSDYQDFITALDRADCHPLTEVPVGGAAAIWGAPMFGAPGVTVVVSSDHTGTFVDGYA